jgi:ankyrin repeat protein
MDVIERALNGDDVNIVDQYGQTALVYAARKDIIETVELLLDKGADPNMVEIYGRTALMIAIISGSTEIVELLLDWGANPNIVDKYDKTALLFAACPYDGHIEIVKLIKDHIALQNAIQNLAMAKSMNSLSSSLQCLDYDIMKEIMICKRTYDHGVHMRMK